MTAGAGGSRLGSPLPMALAPDFGEMGQHECTAPRADRDIAAQEGHEPERAELGLPSAEMHDGDTQRERIRHA